MKNRPGHFDASRKGFITWKGYSMPFAMALAAVSGQAATLTWDSDANFANGSTDGAGIWNTTLANWNNGAADVAWPNLTADTAVFGAGGTTGLVTVDGTVNVGTITFNSGTTGTYTLTGGTINGLGTVNVASGLSARIDSILTGTTLNARNGGTLTLGGTQANTMGLSVYGVTTVLAKSAGVNAVSGNISIGLDSNYSAGGVLRLGQSDQIADTSIVSLYAAHYSGASVFELMGYNETIGGLYSHNRYSTSANRVQNGAATDSVLTLNLAAGTTQKYGNQANVYGKTQYIQNGAAGKLSLVKTGSGTQIIGDANVNSQITYTGTTSVQQGTLSLVSLNFNSSATTLAGGTLSLTSVTANAAMGGTSGQVSITGGTNSNFGGSNKTYSVDTVISGNSTLTQTAANSLSASSTHNIEAGSTLNTGNLTGSVRALAGAGTVNLNGAAANLTVADGGNQTFSGALTGAGKLTKAGGGTQILSGASSHTGGTVVNGGTLIGTNTASLGTNSGLTVASGATFAYRPGAAGALALGSGVINLANGSRVGTAVGGAAGESAITSSGAAVTAGTVTVDVTFIPGVAPTTGSNNLITAGSGLAGAAYVLGNIYNATTFTVSGLTAAADAVSLTVADATPLAAAYWKGGFAGANNRWAVSNGTTASNWASDAAGTDTPLTPGAGATVHFSATGATNQGAMVLGANMSVAGVVFSDTSTVALNADGNTLTLGTGGITVNGGAGAVSLAASIALGGAQAWTNHSANPLAVSGAISGGAALAKAGTGTVTLSGVNTYTGATTINGGTLALSGGSALADTVAVTLADAAGATLQLNASERIGSLAGGGTTGGTVNLGANTLTTGDASTTTFAGVIGGTGGSLTKVGAGTMTLTGANTYTGTTTVSAGTLLLGAASPTVQGPFVMNGADGTYTLMQQPNQFASGIVAQFTSASGAWNRFELRGKGQILAGITTGSATTLGGGVVQNSEANGAAGANATLTLDGSGNYIFNGHLRDYGSTAAGTNKLLVSKTGSGTQTLIGSVISYSGATTVLDGTLKLTNTTVFNSAINNSASVEFNFTGNANFGNGVSLSGAGVYNKTGGATLTFNGSQVISATGTFNILEGTLQNNNNNNAKWLNNQADIQVASGALLDLYADPVYLDALTGQGTVQNNFGNALGTQSGSVAFYEVLRVGVAGGSGNFSGVIRNNATNATLGAGAGLGGIELEKVGAGTQILSGNNTYSGRTTITGGVLQIGAGGTTGSLGAGNVTNNATLTFNRSDFYTVANNISGAGVLRHEGAGTASLTGVNTHTGGTVVGAGTLIATHSSSMGTNSGLTVDAGGTFAYRPGLAGALNLGAGVITLAGGGRIGTAVGGAAGESVITSSSVAVTAGTVTVDVSFIPGVAPTAGSNNLITAAGGLAGATYVLGNIYNATTFTVSGLTAAADAVSITVVDATPLAAAYWKGGFAGANNRWAVSNGTTASNWASDAAGTDTPLTPGAGATVHFSATGATNQGAMVLGANMGVAGVVVDDMASIALNADGNTLTLGTGGITVNGGAGALSLAAPLTLAGAQAWTNDSGNPLTISGAVTAAGNTLTLGGTGNITVSGGLSGTGGLTKSGAGTAILSGANALSGALAVNQGILQIGNASALGSVSGVTVASGARVDLGGNLPGNTLNTTWTIAGDGGDGAGGVGAITNSSGTHVYEDSSILNLTLSGDAEVGGNGGRFDIGRNGATNISNGTINGGGFTLAKVGSNTIVVRGSTASDITYVVNGGLLTFEDNNTASGTNAITVNNGGSLGTYGARSHANNIVLNDGAKMHNSGGAAATWSGAVTLNGAATLDAASGNITYTGAIGGAGGSVVKTGTSAVTFSGSESNSYAGPTELSSTGHLILSKTGGAVAVAGDMRMAATGTRAILSTPLDNQFGPNTVVRWSGSGDTRWELLGTTQTVAGLDSTGFVPGVYAAIQHREFSTPAAVSTLSTLVVNVADGASHQFGNISSATVALRNQGGTVAFTKQGLGTQILAGALIDHTGTTTVSAGTLKFQDLDDLHTVAMSIASGATVEFANSARDFNRFSATVISGDGLFVKSGTSILTTGNSGGYARWNMTGGTMDIRQGEFRADYQDAGSTLAWGGNKASMNVEAGAFVSMVGGNHIMVDALTGAGTVQNINNWGTGIFTVGQNNGSGTFTGTLRNINSSALALTKVGSGTQILSGSNTYTGATTITDGVLQIGSGGTSGTLGTGEVSNNATLRFNRSDTLTVSHNIGGSGILAQDGTGTTVLTGANSYTGNTVVARGKLVVDGSTAAAGLITVASGAALGGGGSGGRTTLEDNAILAPGSEDRNNSNQLILNSLSLSGLSILRFELDTPLADPLSTTPGFFSDTVELTQDLSLGGRLQISAMDGFGDPVEDDSWLLMRYPVGKLAPTGHTLEVDVANSPSLTPGLIYTVDTSIDGLVYLRVAVPEAGSAGLLVMGLLLLRRRFIR